MRFYTVPELAALFVVKPASIYAWIKNGKLECVRIGPLIRVTDEQVNRFLETGALNTATKRDRGVTKVGA